MIISTQLIAKLAISKLCSFERKYLQRGMKCSQSWSKWSYWKQYCHNWLTLKERTFSFDLKLDTCWTCFGQIWWQIHFSSLRWNPECFDLAIKVEMSSHRTFDKSKELLYWCSQLKQHLCWVSHSCSLKHSLQCSHIFDLSKDWRKDECSKVFSPKILDIRMPTEGFL